MRNWLLKIRIFPLHEICRFFISLSCRFVLFKSRQHSRAVCVFAVGSRDCCRMFLYYIWLEWQQSRVRRYYRRLLDVESATIVTITKLLYPLRSDLISYCSNGFSSFSLSSVQQQLSARRHFPYFYQCQSWINKNFQHRNFLTTHTQCPSGRGDESFTSRASRIRGGKQHIEWHKQDWKLFDGKLSGNKFVRSRKIDV